MAQCQDRTGYAGAPNDCGYRLRALPEAVQLRYQSQEQMCRIDQVGFRQTEALGISSRKQQMEMMEVMSLGRGVTCCR